MTIEPANLSRSIAQFDRENDRDLSAATPLRQQRVKAQLTTRTLARLAGVSERTAIRAEQPGSRCSWATYEALAAVLGVDAPSIRP